jgi:4-hydroxybenzoyl-CoA reductase alpha subunit
VADEERKFAVVGTPREKVDAGAKVTGQTLFADDLVLPRMLHCKLHRSRYAHAKIKHVDTRRAAALPGVIAVLTGDALPIPFGILPISQDEHALCQDVARFVGDPIAAVAAVDEMTAEEACRLITVEYEPLRAIESVDDAIATPSPQLHEYADRGNIHKEIALDFGGVDEAMKGADYIADDTFFYEGNTHLAMEQHASLAQWSTDGKLTVWSSTQTPHYLHRALAKVLQMPPAHIRVIATPNGGGFGGKSDPFSHEVVVAELARRTGRPVKICLTREEVFHCHRGRHAVLMRVRTGVKNDGRIVAMDFASFLDGGAYGSYGVASTYYTGALQTVTYEIPAYRFRGLRAFTNKPPCGPKRGHGTPQPRFGVEVQLDKIAEHLKLDPADMRSKILQPANSVTANWLRIGSMGLGPCIDAAVRASGWREKFRKLPFGRGVGIACSSYISGANLPIYWNQLPHSSVQLKLDRSGGVTAFCGSTDIGQGSDTMLAMFVAEVLGIEPVDIRVVTGDTDLTPVDLGSYSSRVTLMTGHAAIQAAERARDAVAAPVAKKLGIPAERVVFSHRRVFDSEDPERGMEFAEAVRIAESALGAIGATGSYTPPKSPGRYKGAGVGPSPAYSYSCAVAEVEVDPDTGIIRVPKVWIAHDIGRAINPMLAIGQVEGSVYMGLGEALMEEMTYRDAERNVVHHHPSMLEYKSPTTLEMCDVETILIEEPEAGGPFGAKEVGQGPLLPIPPAVANAVYDAVGVRVDCVPCQPHMVLRALRDKQKGKAPRFGPGAVPEYKFPDAAPILTPTQGGDGREADERAHSEVGGPADAPLAAGSR